jgi:hypothetical protein
MGKTLDIPGGDDEKPQKPKKAFEMTITVWDDGELTNKLVKFVKKERGAPEKWLCKPEQFSDAIKKNISEDPRYLLIEIAKSLNLDLGTIQQIKEKNA